MRRDGNVVHISEADVLRFNRTWPGSRLQVRYHTVEFNTRGDLVDDDFNPCEDGPEVLAIIGDAQKCL